MKYFVFGFLVCVVLSGMVPSTYAQELQIRGVLANPSALEETEWIALENTTAATLSAQFYTVRDTYGKTVEFPLSGVWQPREIRQLARNTSGITLNNDTEGVELLREGLIIHSAPVFSSPGNDLVWALMDDTWKYIPLEEWTQRLATREWSMISPQSSPSPSPAPSPALTAESTELELVLFSPCTSPEWIEVQAKSTGIASQIRVEDSSGTVMSQEELEFTAQETRRLEWAGAKLSNSGEWVRVVLPGSERLFSYPACQGSLPYRFSAGKWEQREFDSNSPDATGEGGAISATQSGELLPVSLPHSTSSPGNLSFFSPFLQPTGIQATSSSVLVFPSPPVPDFAAEEATFLNWKKQALIGSLALVFAGGCWLFLSLPTLVTWYNEHADPW